METHMKAAEAWPGDADERFEAVERFKELMLSVRIPVRGRPTQAMDEGDAEPAV